MAQVSLTPTECLAAAAMGYLLPLFGALSVIPFFYFCRHLLDDAWAWRATALLTSMPSLSLFFPSIDQVYFFLAMSFLALFAAALQGALTGGKGRAGVGAATGATLAIGLFFSLSLLPLGLLATAIAFLLARGPAERRREVSRAAFAGVAGFIAFYLFMFLVFRFNMYATVRTALAAHHQVTVSEMPRSYLAWVFWNAVDFLMFTGVPAAALFLAYLWEQRRHVISAGRVATEDTQRWLLATAAAFMATVMLLDLSGTVRGEVGRIWMFLEPLPIVFAAARLKAIAPVECAHIVWVVVVCLQALQTMLLQLCVGTGFMRPW